jgi:hypothetical protein
VLDLQITGKKELFNKAFLKEKISSYPITTFRNVHGMWESDAHNIGLLYFFARR